MMLITRHRWILTALLVCQFTLAESAANDDEEEEEEEEDVPVVQRSVNPNGVDPSLALELAGADEELETEDSEPERAPASVNPSATPEVIATPEPPKVVEVPAPQPEVIAAPEPPKVAEVPAPQPEVIAVPTIAAPLKVATTPELPVKSPIESKPQALSQLLPSVPLLPPAPVQATPPVETAPYFPGPYSPAVLMTLQQTRGARENFELNLRRIPIDGALLAAPQSPQAAPLFTNPETDLPIMSSGTPEVSVILSGQQFVPARFRIKSGMKTKIYFTTTQRRPSALVIERLSIQRWIGQHDAQFSNIATKESPKRDNDTINREINSQKMTEIILDPKPGTYGFHDPLSGARGEIIVE